MDRTIEDILQANAYYVSHFGERGDRDRLPARRIAILTYPKRRFEPSAWADLPEDTALILVHVAEGRDAPSVPVGRLGDRALQALVLSYRVLGQREWFVTYPADRGIEAFADCVVRQILTSGPGRVATRNSETGRGQPKGGEAGKSRRGVVADAPTIRSEANQIVTDAQRIRSGALVPANISVSCYVYSIGNGRLVEVPDATVEGQTDTFHKGAQAS